MNQCLHITFFLEGSKEFLQSIVQKKARSLGIEGTAQIINSGGKSVKVIACGAKDAMQDFIDVFHQGVAQEAIKELSIEPLIQERDFRGVFRIIE